MVRSDGGNALGLFEEGVVGIHYGIPEDLTGKSLDQIRALFAQYNPGTTKNRAGGPVGMLDRITNVMQVGDGVVTYDPGTRQYWTGRIAGPYFYEPGDVDLPHRRKVDWDAVRVSRDDLSLAARGSLGPTMALFLIPQEVWQQMKAIQQGIKPADESPVPVDEVEEEMAEEKNSLVEKARERLKDRIVEMDDGQMENLLAAVLRAMGFRTRVSAKGPDRGVDVLASPDGLGLQEPRIKCEVKHRKNTAMGAPEVRSFLGALRAGDRQMLMSFIETQRENLNIEKDRLELQRQESTQAHEYAGKALTVMSTDRREQRAAQDQKNRRLVWLCGGGMLFILLLAAIFVWGGHAELFADVVKILSGMVMGAIGGWGYAKRGERASQDQP